MYILYLRTIHLMADKPLSKHQRRKQIKAQWLAERKLTQIAEGSVISKRKRRNQRQNRIAENGASSPAIHYQVCTSATCSNRLAGNNCVVRSIAPYVHRFALFVKGRWEGRTLRDVFADEFPTLSIVYCMGAAELGLLQVNGQETRLDTKIKAGDFFEHIKHRHEPNVHLPLQTAVELSRLTSLSTKWIHLETDEWMVVNKPSGIPVHPTGTYQFNSLTLMMQHDRKEAAVKKFPKMLELFPVHRLDRLTSGLLLLAKTTEKARSLTSELKACSSDKNPSSRCVQKYYVARVKGDFPTAMSGFIEVKGLASGLVKIESTCDEFWRVAAPIGLMSPRQGHKRCVRASVDSKHCVTLLRRRGKPAGGDSIVECLLVTGRTHQIRVHLHHLGFPIVNDPLYGPEKNDTRTNVEIKQNVRNPDEAVEPFDNIKGPYEDIAHRCVRVCEICTADTNGRVVSGIEEAVLWLHSYRYESTTWSFEVPLPHWAELHEATGSQR